MRHKPKKEFSPINDYFDSTVSSRIDNNSSQYKKSISQTVKNLVSEIKRGWNREEWWRFHLPKLCARAMYRLLFRRNDGTYLMKEDWDNLIILDACRYDLFAENNWIEGQLEERISRGSDTPTFFEENFRVYYPDTVIVSANPFALKFRDFFHAVVYIKGTKRDEEEGTILPETAAQSALEANKKYQDKRLIIHFIQPHSPYIGETRIEGELGVTASGRKRKISNPFLLFLKGKVDLTTLKRAYRDNLLRVLPAVNDLTKELIGKTVITSDHGEAFGEWAKPLPIRIWGHNGPRVKGLVKVPWFIIDKQQRKKITKAERKEQEELEVEEEEIKKRLRALGYMD